MSHDESKPPVAEREASDDEPETAPSDAPDIEPSPQASPFAPAETEIVQKDGGLDGQAFPKAETEEFLGGKARDADSSILLSDDDD